MGAPSIETNDAQSRAQNQIREKSKRSGDRMALQQVNRSTPRLV